MATQVGQLLGAPLLDEPLATPQTPRGHGSRSTHPHYDYYSSRAIPISGYHPTHPKLAATTQSLTMSNPTPAPASPYVTEPTIEALRGIIAAAPEDDQEDLADILGEILHGGTSAQTIARPQASRSPGSPSWARTTFWATAWVAGSGMCSTSKRQLRAIIISTSFTSGTSLSARGVRGVTVVVQLRGEGT